MNHTRSLPLLLIILTSLVTGSLQAAADYTVQFDLPKGLYCVSDARETKAMTLQQAKQLFAARDDLESPGIAGQIAMLAGITGALVVVDKYVYQGQEDLVVSQWFRDLNPDDLLELQIKGILQDKELLQAYRPFDLTEEMLNKALEELKTKSIVAGDSPHLLTVSALINDNANAKKHFSNDSGPLVKRIIEPTETLGRQLFQNMKNMVDYRSVLKSPRLMSMYFAGTAGIFGVGYYATHQLHHLELRMLGRKMQQQLNAPGDASEEFAKSTFASLRPSSTCGKAL